jgi:MtaA/CmuA family methyltransferase
MTGLERAKEALRRGVPDVVPVFSRDLTFPLDVVGYTTPEVCRGGPNGVYDGEKAAKAVIASVEHLGHDIATGTIWDLGLSSDAYGGETQYPEYGIPMVKTAAFKEHPELIDTAQPLDFKKDGRYPGILKSYRLVSEKIGKTKGIAVNIEGPVTEASMMRNVEDLVFDMMADPEMAEKMLNLATTNIIHFIEECFDAGANCAAFLASSNDGTEILTPEYMVKYSLPNITKIVNATKKLGYPVVYHPHGNFTDEKHWDLLEKSIDTGIAGFQFAENNNYKLAKEKWGKRVAILGGIDIANAILPGPTSRIEEEVKNRVRDCAPGGGYVVMAACSLHRKTPIPHVKAMTDAAHKFGKYPINVS